MNKALSPMDWNIIKEYIFTIFYNMNFVRGLWMIYLASRGFSLIQLGIMESCFHITSFIMEIPTGAVADIWGKKVSRIIGRLLYIISMLILFLSNIFGIQILGFVISAIGFNLESGAGEALLYDSITHEGIKAKYMSIAGKKEFILQCSCIVALILGGYIAMRSYLVVFSLSILSAVLSIITASTFVEPKIKRTMEIRSNIFLQIKDQTVNSIKVIKKRKQIAFFIIFSEMIFSFTVTLFFYLQNFWKSEGFSEFKIGLIFAVAALFSGIASLLTHRIEKKIGGEQGLIIFIPIFVIVAFWGISLTSYKYLFYLLIGLMEGFLFVAVSDYINRLIPAEYRATVLSFQSMVFSFFMIILFPVIGWIGDNYGLNFSFLVFTLVASFIGILYFIFNRNPVKTI
jgi:MFS family permease